MKYKFKICNTDIFASEGLEKQLNKMAGQGYELILSSLSGFPVVCYEKTEEAINKRYSVELIRKDDAELLQYCEDAGWKLLKHSKNEQCIFATEKENIAPIFSDSASRNEYAEKVVYYNSTVGCSIGAYLGLAVFLGILTWFVRLLDVWLFPLNFLLGAGWIILALGLGQIFANYFYMKRMAKRVDVEGVRSQPGMLRIWNHVNFYLFIITFASTWVYYVIEIFFQDPNLFARLLILLAPFLLVGGFALRAIRQEKVIGHILMFLGIWLIMGGIRTIENLL